MVGICFDDIPVEENVVSVEEYIPFKVPRKVIGL
jgi:hypothetical protein